MADTTLVLIKPDGVARKLTGEIINRIECKGLEIVALEKRTIDEDTARRHYAEHLEKPFFPDLLSFITSAPLVAMVVSGREAVAVMRTMMGETDPIKSAPGSIRGDLAIEMTENLVHGSDSTKSAEREIGIFFPK